MPLESLRDSGHDAAIYVKGKTMHYADATLTVHLDAIAANYRLIATRVAPAEAAAVVKADAYGLGVIPVAERLVKEGCRLFFVATLDEAVELRIGLPSATIAVFHGVRFGQEQVFLEHHLIPVLNTLEQISRWSVMAVGAPSALPAMMHIDTGMNRLGLSISEAEALVRTPEKLRGLDVQAVMSHLACSSDRESLMNHEQLKFFNQLRTIITGTKYSLANSGGCLADACYHFDMVRPGCALYGINPYYSGESPLAPAVTLRAKILQIRTVDRAGSVGYGASYAVQKGGRLAVLPVGYADGYLRSLSGNGAWARVAGVKVPVAGRVSMDMVVLDISDVPEGKLTAASEAELLGVNSMSVDEAATRAGTIGYEILTRLGKRFKRVYAA